MTKIKRETLINISYVLITCIVFFTTLDLIYGSTKQSVIALICSSLSGLIVFVGAYIKKKNDIKKGIDNTFDFIYSNFNKASIILSILDIICSLIAVLTTLYWFSMIFRAIFGVRAICITNKVKTILKPFVTVLQKYINPIRLIIISAYLYLFYRINNKRRKTMAETEVKVKDEKVSVVKILCALFMGLGVIFAVVSYFVPAIQINGTLIWNEVIVAGVEFVSILVALFCKDKKLTDEEKQAIIDKATASFEKAKKIAEEIKQAKIAKTEAKLAKLNGEENKTEEPKVEQINQ